MGCEKEEWFLSKRRYYADKRRKEKPNEVYEYNKKYQENNRQLTNSWKQKHKKNNPEKVREQAARYNQENSEVLSFKASLYYIKIKIISQREIIDGL